MKTICTEKSIIKSWCNEPEHGAIEQAKNLANLPFIHKHVCLMPDTHQGYGMPIGGVIATKGVVIPNAVGVDIGCGMCAVRTSLTEINTSDLKCIVGGIRSKVPTGFSKHKEWQEWAGWLNAPTSCLQHIENARLQVGTLGGGNHFIEIQKGSDGYVWIMIHSGSRNLGKQVADYYHKEAKRLCNMWNVDLPNDELAYLPVDSEAGEEYLKAMNFALSFALDNRMHMIEACKKEFSKLFPDCSFNEVINIHHNYASLESHFGENVWVHRKGATSAKQGELGIIPGSQGTFSYIVKGKGNLESFMSCSHGAGRKMSRKKAQENLSLEEETKLLDDKGIIHAIRGEKDLDEAPGAYKDIDVVMKEQADLVDIVVKLTPLAVIKG